MVGVLCYSSQINSMLRNTRLSWLAFEIHPLLTLFIHFVPPVHSKVHMPHCRLAPLFNPYSACFVFSNFLSCPIVEVCVPTCVDPLFSIPPFWTMPNSVYSPLGGTQFACLHAGNRGLHWGGSCQWFDTGDQSGLLYRLKRIKCHMTGIAVPTGVNLWRLCRFLWLHDCVKHCSW